MRTSRCICAPVVAGGMPSDFARYPDSPIIQKYLGASYRDKPELWKSASPINNVSQDTPPTLLYHGDLDQMVRSEDSEAMKAALDAANVTNELVQVHGSGHATTFLFGGGAEDEGMAFLDQYLRATPVNP